MLQKNETIVQTNSCPYPIAVFYIDVVAIEGVAAASRGVGAAAP